MRRDLQLRPATSAFTLIELLVTIAMIAILAALVLPALSSAKYHGKNAVCKNNLRQIHLAMQTYVSTHDMFPTYWQLQPEPQEWPLMLELPVVYENITVKTRPPFSATRL